MKLEGDIHPHPTRHYATWLQMLTNLEEVQMLLITHENNEPGIPCAKPVAADQFLVLHRADEQW